MVDFSIFVDPHSSSGGPRDQEAAITIDHFLHSYQKVNHTEHEALSRMAVAVSVVAKRTEVDFEKAQLQTGVWHSAHLRMLQTASGSWSLRAAARGATAPTAETTPRSQQGKDSSHGGYGLGLHDWLPGLIILGHQWFFVATVRHGLDGIRPVCPGFFSSFFLVSTMILISSAPKAMLSSVRVGSTQDPLGIYSVLAAIHCLADWAGTQYWPAFRERVLGL